jgi:hypothetical protein
MDLQNIKNTEIKLKRLNVDSEFSNNTFILKGTSLSSKELFLSIILPFVFFVLAIILFIIMTTSPEIDSPPFFKIFFTLPIYALYYGIKNLIKIKKSKKNQVHIMSGKLILINENNDKIILKTEDIKEMVIKIEEASTIILGEIYITNVRDESYLLLSLNDNNYKYLKNDLEYIKSTFLMVLNANFTS